jgi:predicted nucleotidyltransferase
VHNSLPPSGPALRRAFDALVATFHERGIRYAIIGGIAVIQYARVRTTDDIATLLTIPQISLPGLLEALEARGFTVDLERNLREMRDGGLMTLQFADVVVDLMRPVLPLYAHVLDHAVEREVFGQKVRMSSAEGLIVMKLIAMRPQDEIDIRDIFDAFAGKLDLDYIRRELATFADRDDPRWVKLESWLVGSSSPGA